ncbi:Rgg/GadR/MutR family transcriptional regulator [Listeria aquatica]|uniref:Transcriptional regulator n=1 Tax=Listeria aquatica FSL S10-1188 TaxID=1265818 RepID=W7B9N5_9LIST|nr:Rgg/GadR/MutR family transcriptional regulator [Listeria aquatica]EUJ16613.1 transcriptional regulator [Listeria aquatica FSL S10-1188]
MLQKKIKTKDAGDGLSRTKYYNIENDITQPTYDDLLLILKNLNMDVVEFEFIRNNKQTSERVQLLNRFQSHGHSLKAQKGRKLVEDLKKYGEQHNDTQILNLGLVLDAINILTFDEDLKKANAVVEPVWKRLKSQENWLLYDIIALNNMLYHLTEEEFQIYLPKLFESVESYEGILDSKRATVLVNVNIAYGLRQKHKFSESKPFLEEAIKHAESYNLVMYYDLLYKLAEVLYVEGERGEANRLAIESIDMLVSLKKK